MIPKQSNREEENKDSEHLPDEEEYEKYLGMQDYYAEIAEKEMEEAKYLPDGEEYQKMLDLCEAMQDKNSDTPHEQVGDIKGTSSLVSKQEKKSTGEKALSVHVEDLGDGSFQANAEPDYISIVHNETLAKILRKVTPIDLIETMVRSLGDKLIKYQDTYGEIVETKIPSQMYAVAIMSELYKVVSENGWGFAQEDGMTYVYTEKYWEKINYDILGRFLSIFAIKLGFYSSVEALTERFIKILLKQFLATAMLMKRKKDSSTVLINLSNGTYEVTPRGTRRREYNPRDFLTYILPFEYNADAKAPLFMKYLERVLPDMESQHVLQEFHGYVFTRDLKLEKALILYGRGANGKSVQYEISKSLFGKENVSNKGLGDLVDRDSGNDNRAKLKDKLLNYGSEISAKQVNVDLFKKLVSGEPVAAREKYKTSFDLENQCKFIFNANKLPDTEEHTDAFYRRFLIIPYKERIPDEERDPELHNKIVASELSGVFNWVLEGLERLLKQKDFSKCEASIKELEEYKRESNYVLLFTEDRHLEASTENRFPTSELYKMYQSWAKENGIALLSKPKFSKELELLDYKRYRSAKERGFYMRTKDIEE